MPEELYFIKTNPTVAKINLYNKLCREEENILKFLQTDRNTNLEIIKDKVKDSVEELTKEELLHIFSWFSTLYPSDREEIKTQLFINGIDLFYEIPSTIHVNSFLEILSDYEKNMHQDLGFIVNAQHFNQFLIYGIFLTEMANKQQGENVLSSYLKTDYESLYRLAENQLSTKNIVEKTSPELQLYFTDLYDLTKFYKGSIIRLENQ
ncbi:hypothetical protein HX13_03570 [Chryseobacterium sp. P1-3]|uniref:Uncharacterized protein n=1 Tax=Chryseobacterium gallinarum TaxID=1324352 RepID=A0ABX6KWU6_CHRGL|nr:MULTISPECIES: hypothetical protein [Chryseobacterium]KFF75316.1 hypothetical protein HX13_03570 [Chryseobacterium sp. P1-3]QIY92543.1 hypothetical protein FOB44_18625 [Chryseobacterium gallinarum]